MFSLAPIMLFATVTQSALDDTGTVRSATPNGIGLDAAASNSQTITDPLKNLFQVNALEGLAGAAQVGRLMKLFAPGQRASSDVMERWNEEAGIFKHPYTSDFITSLASQEGYIFDPALTSFIKNPNIYLSPEIDTHFGWTKDFRCGSHHDTGSITCFARNGVVLANLPTSMRYEMRFFAICAVKPKADLVRTSPSKRRRMLLATEESAVPPIREIAVVAGIDRLANSTE
eukprot:gene33923-43834_t